MPKDPVCQQLEYGFWSPIEAWVATYPGGRLVLETAKPKPEPGKPQPERVEHVTVRIITSDDLAKWQDCFRQYRVGFEVGKSNTLIINEPPR